MSSFSGSPRVTKGALVGIDLFNPLSSVVVFQYNPDTVTRTLQPQTAGEGAARSEAMRLKGAPVESIKLDVEIDATDQLEKADGLAVSTGIYPQLSALEMLVYPKSALVIANTVLLALGTLEIVPPIGPFTLLIWGLKRVVPVRLTEFSITEEAHDVSLNPIRAKVSLGLRVLSYNDLSITNPGYWVFLTHQIVKETMATIGSVSNIGAVEAGDMFHFSSRYYNLETVTFVLPDGRPVRYKRRRFLPQGEAMPVLVEVNVAQDDRLDLITARTLGDPEQFWRIADANNALNPFDLTTEIGRRLRVPIPQAGA
jgi:hypothetical protein